MALIAASGSSRPLDGGSKICAAETRYSAQDNAPVATAGWRRAASDTARQLGLLDGENGRIGGRVRCRNGRQRDVWFGSDTELLEYALAKVALEDDLGAKLVRRKGRIANDIDLGL